MTSLRSLIFASLSIAAALAAAGCQDKAGPSSAAVAAAEPALKMGDPSRVDRLILRLGAEEIVPGPTVGGSAFFAGEFDRLSCPAVDELVNVGLSAVSPLKKALGSDNPIVSRNAAFALARLGQTAAVNRLYAAVEDSSLQPLIRARAVDLLIDLAAKTRGQAALDFPRLAAVFAAQASTNSASRHVRMSVLRAAGLDRGAEARELVLSNLDSRDRALRCAAIEATASLALKEPPEPVVKALDDRNPRIVAAAMAAVGHIRPEDLSARFAALLKNPDAAVRIDAVRLVARLAPPGGAALLADAIDDRDLEVQREAVAAVEKLGSLEMLQQALENPRWRVRKASVEALARLKAKQALSALADLTQDDSFNVRAALALAVGEIGHPSGTTILLELLSDSAASVRDAARESFARLSGEALDDYNPAMAPWQNEEALNRARAWVKTNAGAFPAPAGARKPPEGPPANEAQRKVDVARLIDALALPPGPTRQLAVSALVRQGADVMSDLEAAVDARPAEVRQALLEEVLPVIDPFYMNLIILSKKDDARRRQAAIRFAREVAGRKPPQAVWTQVRQALRGETDDLVRRLLVERLCEVGDSGAAEALIEGLAMEDPRTRQSSALLLGKLKSRSAIAPLVKALHDERTTVQYAAAWALGEIGDPSAIQPIERMLVTRDLAGRLAFGTALAKLGAQSGRDELVRLMVEAATTTQVEVAEAMAAAPDETYVPILIEKLDPNNLRLTTALAEALRAVTGQDFGYRPQATRAVRDRALDQWRRWFEETQKVKTPATKPANP